MYVKIEVLAVIDHANKVYYTKDKVFLFTNSRNYPHSIYV